MHGLNAFFLEPELGAEAVHTQQAVRGQRCKERVNKLRIARNNCHTATNVSAKLSRLLTNEGHEDKERYDWQQKGEKDRQMDDKDHLDVVQHQEGRQHGRAALREQNQKQLGRDMQGPVPRGRWGTNIMAPQNVQDHYRSS